MDRFRQFARRTAMTVLFFLALTATFQSVSGVEAETVLRSLSSALLVEHEPSGGTNGRPKSGSRSAPRPSAWCHTAMPDSGRNPARTPSWHSRRGLDCHAARSCTASIRSPPIPRT